MPEATLSPTTRGQLTAAGLDADQVARLVRRALAEDLGERGDITTAAAVDADLALSAVYIPRAAGVAAGLAVIAAVYDVLAPGAATVSVLVGDGSRIWPGQPIAAVDAPAHVLLAAERTSLNLLGHLCGIATATRRWVDAVAGTGARIRDTRKTTPGLRDLEKYAVRCGGGVNHRRGLFDAYLIKDNHVAAAGGIGPALTRVQARRLPDLDLQVEVDNLDQLAEALAHQPPSILLDNFPLADLATAVRRIRSATPATIIEASGGLHLDTAAAVAASGVDYLSVGAITHSAAHLDIGLDAR